MKSPSSRLSSRSASQRHRPRRTLMILAESGYRREPRPPEPGHFQGGLPRSLDGGARDRAAKELEERPAVIRFIVSTMWTGMRMVRAWSAMARVRPAGSTSGCSGELEAALYSNFSTPRIGGIALGLRSSRHMPRLEYFLGDRHDQAQVGDGQVIGRRLRMILMKLALAVPKPGARRDRGV